MQSNYKCCFCLLFYLKWFWLLLYVEMGFLSFCLVKLKHNHKTMSITAVYSTRIPHCNGQNTQQHLCRQYGNFNCSVFPLFVVSSASFLINITSFTSSTWFQFLFWNQQMLPLIIMFFYRQTLCWWNTYSVTLMWWGFGSFPGATFQLSTIHASATPFSVSTIHPSSLANVIALCISMIYPIIAANLAALCSDHAE